MSKHKIYLISPREPSGATWLINCFLELGIKTYRSSRDGMWREKGKHYSLGTHETHLKKWLPVLSRVGRFHFRDDVEVEWSHQWPEAPHDNVQIIYFVRDPRDSFFSRYKREAPNQTFEEFLTFPDFHTLLNKLDNWRLFNLAWMAHPNVRIFRFEDYKQDAQTLLLDVLNFMGLSYPLNEVSRAVYESMYEKAAEAEQQYRLAHPDDEEIINRSGTVGEWRQGALQQDSVTNIAYRCADVMARLGYLPTDFSVGNAVDYSSLICQLPMYRATRLTGIELGTVDGRDVLSEVITFSEALDVESLRQAKLRDYEVRELLDNILILRRNLGLNRRQNIAHICKELKLNRSLLQRCLSLGLGILFPRNSKARLSLKKMVKGMPLWRNKY